MAGGLPSEATMVQTISNRLSALEWVGVQDSLARDGYATTPSLLNPDECSELVSLYGDDANCRSRIVMSRSRSELRNTNTWVAPCRTWLPSCARERSSSLRRWGMYALGRPAGRKVGSRTARL